MDNRLPENVRPAHYHLTLAPDLKTFTFEGGVAIDIEVLEETSEITLHAADLSIDTAKIASRTFSSESRAIKFNEEAQTVILGFEKTLPKGNYRLSIPFKGVLNDKMCGFYRSSYKVDGEERFMAVTQFEATDARRAFPCWDEPAIKATFTVSIYVPKNLQVLSNMPLWGTSDLGSDKLVVFEKTPPMSTYLLAFAVGELESIETATVRGLPIRVWTTPGKVEQGRFALDVAKRSIEFFEEYLGVPYSLPKLDLLAVPDFASGAMENWGLITFRENALLYDPEKSAISAKQYVASTVVHENIHELYFGNLVTMKWWDDLWLNEGFATWFESLCVNHLFPEWDIWTQFVSSDYASALAADGLLCTHPIEVEVNNPAEIGEIFDAISYEKGACVIRMLVEYLGEDVFKKCLKAYFGHFAYANASTDDLCAVFEGVSGKPVKSFMDGWIKQAGYPVVTAKQYRSGFVILEQERFLSQGGILSREDERKRWIVPLDIGLEGLKEPRRVVLSDKSDQLRFGVGDKWLKVNKGQGAFCRAHYESELLRRLYKPIAGGELPPIDRFGILNDVFYNARAGRIATSELFSLLPYYKGERNYAVWQGILGILWSLDDLLFGTDVSKKLTYFSLSLMDRIGQRVGWDPNENEPHTEKLLRSAVLRGLGNLANDPATALEANKRFKSGASPDLKEAVYGIVAAHGGEDRYQSLLDMYRASNLSEERVRILRALGKFRSTDLVRAALEFSLSGEVRPQDAIFIMGSAGANAHGRNQAWRFLQENWEVLNKRYAEGGLFLLQSVIGAICGDFVSEDKADEIEKFFAEHPAPSAKRAIEKSLERIRMNARWLVRDLDSIREFFTDRYGDFLIKHRNKPG